MPDQYTVSALTRYIRALFDSDLQLQDVWVEGEVSNFTRASSGHWYFTLKDEQSALRCVMWRSDALRQPYIPQHGDAALAHGRVSVYEAGGQYQLYADFLQPAGRGDLYRQFELLRARLEAEGLFDPAHKRPLPAFPRRIGVVTSPTAAAFQDVLNVLRRRYPLAEVILSPTLVQGDEAPLQIARALEAINRADVDVILLVRGGGSLEDLWAFNDERVARAVYASRAPVVTGVGHEIDFTMADFVADLRAPTPSAAAEISTPDVANLEYTLRDLRVRLLAEMGAQINTWRRQVEAYRRDLRRLSPRYAIENARQRLDGLASRAALSLRHAVERGQLQLQARQEALLAADPRAILARGYAIVERAEDRQRLRRARDVSPGEGLHIRLAEGRLTATVEDTSDE